MSTKKVNNKTISDLPAKTRRSIVLLLMKQQRGKCLYCEKKVFFWHHGLGQHKSTHPDRATLEHYRPRSLGGVSTLDNLAVACLACNSSHGNVLGDEFNKYGSDEKGKAKARNELLAAWEV